MKETSWEIERRILARRQVFLRRWGSGRALRDEQEPARQRDEVMTERTRPQLEEMQGQRPGGGNVLRECRVSLGEEQKPALTGPPGQVQGVWVSVCVHWEATEDSNEQERTWDLYSKMITLTGHSQNQSDHRSVCQGHCHFTVYLLPQHINSTPFHSPKCSRLKEKLYGYPLQNPFL